MKIVHLCLAGPVTDGWTYQDNILPKYHRKMNHEVTIIASRWVYDNENNLYKYPKTDYNLPDGIHMIRLDIKNEDNFHNRFKKYYSVYETIEKEAPDILFVHGCQFLDIKSVKKYVEKNPYVRVFVDNHADFSNSASNWLSKKILHGVVWRSCAQLIEPYTEMFYGVLPARVDFLHDIYKIPRKKIELLVMGVDDEKIETSACPEVRQEIRKKYNISDEDFLIITGGKIDKAKWQTLLLMEAVKKINNSKVKLIVFGSVDAELEEKVKSLSEGEKIQYIGWVNAEDSYGMFAASDLVIFPGRHSVFWEQVVGQGIPMVVKFWEGTTHVDCNGNVKFLYCDSVDEIETCIEEILREDIYSNMKRLAEEASINFLYSRIAERSISKRV